MAAESLRMLNSFLLLFRFLVLVFSGHRHVALENIALRHQLAVFTREKRRPRLRDRDRIFWITLQRLWKDWRSALVFVQPETVTGWQRKRFKRYWWRLSQSKGPGRPRVDSEIRKLVRTMAGANPIWGAPRIHGELQKLGFEISERTVSRLMPNKDSKPTQTWTTFLRNHVGQMVSIDFFNSRHDSLANPLCLHCPGARSTPHRPLQCHAASDGGLGRTANHRSISGRPRSPVYDSGPRRNLRQFLHIESRRNAHRTNSHCTTESLAEFLCRARDRKRSSRVPESCDRFQRQPPAPIAQRLFPLLSRVPHAPVLE